jgi:solute carrier family 31 (copper transporter), member 1
MYEHTMQHLVFVCISSGQAETLTFLLFTSIIGFISSTWHITSKGMFAGSCIGVILLVIALEFLRRAGTEYDRFIVSQHTNAAARSQVQGDTASSSTSPGGTKNVASVTVTPRASAPFRPSIPQQSIRALLHMLQFAVAYFIMLLAMYYNGYIIICIFIGAYIGSFIFNWQILATP